MRSLDGLGDQNAEWRIKLRWAATRYRQSIRMKLPGCCRAPPFSSIYPVARHGSQYLGHGDVINMLGPPETYFAIGASAQTACAARAADMTINRCSAVPPRRESRSQADNAARHDSLGAPKHRRDRRSSPWAPWHWVADHWLGPRPAQQRSIYALQESRHRVPPISTAVQVLERPSVRR